MGLFTLWGYVKAIYVDSTVLLVLLKRPSWGLS